MGIPATLSSVPAQTPYIQYVATSGQTVFPYPFEITQDSDLVVVANGTTLATDSGYTLSGVGNSTGGNLTFTSGRTVGDIITLYRDIPIERLTQFAQNGGFSSTAFNAEFNNVYLLLQQLQSSIDQCLQIPNTNNPAATTVLTPAAYANMYLAFDSHGNPVPAALTSSGSITTAIVTQQLNPTGLIFPQTLGGNPYPVWMPSFGLSCAAAIDTTAQGAFVGAVENTKASNTVAEPCGITGYGRVNNSGNAVFGVFGRADLRGTSGVACNEFDAFNYSGSPAASTFPPSRGIGTAQNVTNALYLGAGGANTCWTALEIGQEGSTFQKWLCGIYLDPGAITTYGMLIDAYLSDTHTPLIAKHSANENGVQAQGVGTINGFAITGTAGQCSCAATNLTVGMQVKIAGTFGGTGSITGYANPTTYAISATDGSTTFTLQTLTGGALVTTAGTPSGITVTALLPGGAGYLYTDPFGNIEFKVTQLGQILGSMAQAVPAGGSQSVGVCLTSTANLGMFVGSGAPTLSAAKGSFYLRTDGSSSSTRMYINTDGAATWTNVTTAA